MTPELWEKVSAVLAQIESLSKPEADAFLARLDEYNPTVAAEVRSLLDQEESTHSPGLDSFVQQAARVLDHSNPDPTAGATVGLSEQPAPFSSVPKSLPTEAGKYLVVEEIARGGMGAVWRVQDPDFHRTLAMKVLLGTLKGKADLEDRFWEEAQIAGQLQHPGIAPVHELGRLADGRPFFTMKLIEGQTLALLLKERQSPAENLPKFLAIFEQICQTVGYAHSKGIIHRDLKPSNVMVGEFGEVQVMDWGLAKVLDRPNSEGQSTDPIGDIGKPTNTDDDETLTQNVLPDTPGAFPTPSRTRAGSVMGTPGYMAPEQARGETNELDERCDVFGLGSILCEILTGKLAFVGVGSRERLELTVQRDLDDAFTRLTGCQAEAGVDCIDETSVTAGQGATATKRRRTRRRCRELPGTSPGTITSS